MKRIYIALVLFGVLITDADDIYGQGNYSSQPMNFTVTTKVIVPGITLESQLPTMTTNQYLQKAKYMDDNGRVIQAINVRGSAAGSDVVQDYTYDALGRDATKYLPMTHTATDGRYKAGLLTSGTGYPGSAHAAFYNTGTGGIPIDSKPYRITYYEPTPTGRVMEQGGVGAAWQKHSTDPLESHTVTQAYGTNAASEVRSWTVTGDGQASSLTGGYYPAGMLAKLTTTQMVAEQGNDHDSEYTIKIEYKDVFGRTVMTKEKADATNWAETYYVYDKYGRLRFVLPPELLKSLIGQPAPSIGSVPSGYTLLTTDQTFTSNNSNKYVYATNVVTRFQPPPGGGSTTLGVGFHIMPQQGASGSATLLANMAFQFIYDSEGRKIGEKAPGADWTFYVYDKRDRLALSQSGNQRLGNKWSFMKYDNLNRPVLIGETTIAKDRDGVLSDLLLDADLFEARGGSYHGYTNNTYPSVTNLNEYTLAKYYDDYTFKSLIGGTAYDYKPAEISGLIPANEFLRVNGINTGSKFKIPGPDTWQWTVSYYDSTLNNVQNITGNHLSGTDIVSATYNFVGWKTSKRETHSSSITSYTALEQYTYDITGRLLTTTHKKGTSPEVLLSKNTYNEVGTTTKREIHSTDTGSSFFMTNNLTSNIKGWPQVNNYELGTSGTFLDLWYQYNEPAGTLTQKQRYDGSVSWIEWYHEFGIPSNAYELLYDPMSRLTSAQHFGGTVDNSVNEATTYDLNGNIKTLTRNSGKYTAVQSDNLTYDYGSTPSNVLKSVTDNATTNASVGFNDLNKSGDDYTYDNNGNLTSDKNRGITSITYNLLNLPTRMDFSDGNYILYTYDATGNKVSQDYRNSSSSIEKRDYVGGILYVNGALAMANHSEGRLIPSQNANLVVNATAGTTAGYNPNQATLAVETISSETYVSATYTGSNFTTPFEMWRGIRAISNVSGNGLGYFLVNPGETYLYRVLGYQQTGVNATPYVTDFGDYLVKSPTKLPVGSANQNWVDIEFTVPDGVTAVFIGVAWDGANTNDKFYVNHVSLYNRDWEYELYATDALGNIRAVMQTKPSVITYRATMETENYSTESVVFQNVTTPNILVNSAANATTGGDEVIKLNSVNRIGPAKSLKLFQEDRINLKVSAYFATPPGSMGQVAGGVMATALVNAITSGGGQAFVDGVTTAYNTTGTGNPNFTLGAYQGTSYPSAFLNYILFDENYVPVAAKSTPLANTPNVKQTLSISNIIAHKQGYIYVYISYDNTNTSYDVYFDELEITHTESNYVQLNDYYPFGMLSYTWTRDGELDNRLAYQGKELDPASGLYDFHARLYDAATGRFASSDPKGALRPFHSPYAAMGNNPTLNVDPDGEFFATALTFVYDFFRTAFFKGGLDITSKKSREGAWHKFDPTARGSKTNNAWRIFMGLFALDTKLPFNEMMKQYCSRFTKEGLIEFIGYWFAIGTNLFHDVEKVDYYAGATVLWDNTKDHSGTTVGSYIDISAWRWNDYKSLGRRPGFNGDYAHDELFIHEYGHYVQARHFGSWHTILGGLNSMISMWIQDHAKIPKFHDNTMWEMDASQWGLDYFIDTGRLNPFDTQFMLLYNKENPHQYMTAEQHRQLNKHFWSTF